MIIYLPYADFIETGKCLYFKDFIDQRLIINQILENIIFGQIKHPEEEKWAEHILTLGVLQKVYEQERLRRGYNLTDELQVTLDLLSCDVDELETDDLPSWLYNEEMHREHRLKLLEQHPVHYGKFWSYTNLRTKEN